MEKGHAIAFVNYRNEKINGTSDERQLRRGMRDINSHRIIFLVVILPLKDGMF